MVATDVAARGIDVDDITHVINYNLPDDLAYYTHRSGRTGRAGNKGIAVALITPSEQRKVRELERQLGITFNKATIPSAAQVVTNSLQSRMDDLMNIQESEEARVWAANFAEQMEGKTAEDIVAKIFTQYLANLKQESKGDLNAKSSDRGRERGRDSGGRDRDSGGRSDRGRRDSSRREDKYGKNDSFERRKDRDNRDSSNRDNRTSSSREGSHDDNMDRFYVSIGREDELQKADILKIVCDASGVRSRFIGKIQLYGKHTLIDVDKTKSQNFPGKFDGLRFNGRKLKVSLDNPS